jgi:hypothetical protein
MDLPNGTVVNRPRVLGVRIDVEGDPARAEPRPGESVTLRWLVVPGGDAWMSALTACVAAPANTGFPGCAEAPFAFAPPGTPSPSPSFALSVPVGAAGRSILVAGVLCANGVPTLPEEGLPDCEGEDATTERVIFTFDVAGDAPPNQHPSWAEQTFTIDEQAWDAPPAELPTSGCAAVAGAPALPRITRRIEDEPSTITFTTRAEDRETYDELVLGEMPTFETRREDLRITHAATGGFFPRLSTEVFDDEAPTPNVPWRHPTEEEVPEDGLTVRFWFVMRDGRGGMDWIERAACVVR